VSASSGFPPPVRPVNAPSAVTEVQSLKCRAVVLGDGFPREGALCAVAVPFTAHDALGVRTLESRPRQEAVGRHPSGGSSTLHPSVYSRRASSHRRRTESEVADWDPAPCGVSSF